MISIIALSMDRVIPSASAIERRIISKVSELRGGLRGLLFCFGIWKSICSGFIR